MHTHSAVFERQLYHDDAVLEVLVVDDEEEVLRLLGLALHNYCFRVRLADSGKKDVELFRRYHSYIDVVLTDVLMPGMDGPEMLAELRTIAPEIPVVFMTGGLGHYSNQDLIEMSGCDVLTKPFNSLEKIARQLLSAAVTGRLLPID